MHALRSWMDSFLVKRQRVRVSVGLDLGPDFASWVILSGSQVGVTSVVCAERLTLPEAWVEAGRITQPPELGRWLRQALIDRSCKASELSIGIADAFIASHRLSLVSLMSRGEANQLAQISEPLAQPVRSLEPVVANYSVALGLAMSAWRPAEFNFLPHREKAQQAERLVWLRHALTCFVAGACLAASMGGTLDAMTDTLQAKLPPSKIAAATRGYQVAKQTHDQLVGMVQGADAQAKWLLGQQNQQASTLAWHRLMGQPVSGVWVSHVIQKGAQWSVHGEALSSHDAQQWVRRWGELDIWTKPPQLPAMQLTPSLSHHGVPVWQFQMDAELKVVR